MRGERGPIHGDVVAGATLEPPQCVGVELALDPRSPAARFGEGLGVDDLLGRLPLPRPVEYEPRLVPDCGTPNRNTSGSLGMPPKDGSTRNPPNLPILTKPYGSITELRRQPLPVPVVVLVSDEPIYLLSRRLQCRYSSARSANSHVAFRSRASR